jgi:hypothetical protein
MIALDMFCNQIYGGGSPLSTIDEIGFQEYASFNDDTVSDGNGGTKRAGISLTVSLIAKRRFGIRLTAWVSARVRSSCA